MSSGTTVTHPSGTSVYFESQPKRIYRVNGLEVPSVTSILGCLDKPGLPWWGMKVGVEGCLALASKGVLELVKDRSADHLAEKIVAKLTEHKLTVNHQRDKAGDRGSRVHDAFEQWAAMGTIPHPNDYPDEDRGYIQGLSDFLTDVHIEPVSYEVMVGSQEHGYAGRFDLRARITQESRVVTKVYPKKNALYTTIPPGEGIWDLKTSSSVYPTSHFRQLEAYEGASIECGYAPTNWRAILHVTADGRYEVRRSKATLAQFLAVKQVYDDNETIEKDSKL